MSIKPLFAKLRSTLKHLATGIPIGAALSLCLSLPASAQPAVLTAQPGSQINVRTSPTTLAPAYDYGLRGDRVEVLSQTTGSDGRIWYNVRFVSGVVGWVRADFVALSSPVRPAPRPVLPASGLYTAEQINYFLEVALGSEFGSRDAIIRKWSGSVRIRVNGTPTSEDLRSLNAVISDINGLAQGIHLQLDSNNPNIELYFAPKSQFSRIDPNYQPVNLGYFWSGWNQNTLNRATVLISTTGVTQTERSHLIREELTQSLGLMRDSYRYPDSIFYQGWTDPTQFSAIDKVLIQMLYRPEVRAGMTRSQVVSALREIPLAARSTPIAPPLNPSNGIPLNFSLEQP